jgi:hypothetical protein
MTTGFRALCAELFENLERYQCWYIEDNGYGIDELEALLDRADAALSQPEPQGPTDEELVELFNENDWNYISPETFLDIARSVLELR